MKKRLFTLVLACFACFGLASCKPKDPIVEHQSITVSFEGAESMTLEEGKEIDLPEISLNAGEELLGWALRANETTPVFVDTLAYDEASDYASNGNLKLYPCVDYSIEVTIKGVTEVKTVVSKNRNNNANLPIVEQSERQKWLGWATTQDAVAAQLDTTTVINYGAVKDLANNAKVTLYPVIENYDIMICVHGSHSNGNVYMSDAQRAELKALLEERFDGKNILIDYVDLANASTFATEAIKKDYDIVLTSKSARNQGTTDGDIATAAKLANKSYYAEADANETVLQLIDLNQSRQVCRFLGSNNVKPLQEEVYTFLTTPKDKTVTIKFVNGDLNETIEAHRVVDGAVSNVAYVPTNTLIMSLEHKVFDGWALTPNATEVLFPNATYANAASVAVDGVATLYPVFVAEPDAYIVVWGINGTNEYVSEAQFATIQSLFNTYLTNHSIDTQGKNIQLVYFEGKTDDFKAELTKEYLVAAVGAAALNNSDYASYWTYNPNYYAKVVNVTCTNASRYCALRNGAETNEFAVAFYNALCEAEISVTFKYGEITSEKIKVNSVTKNVATMPETIVGPDGSFVLGYALTENATEPTFTGDVTYATVAEYATNGEVTLYPVFGRYDLIVYVWCGQSKTGTTYVTEEEVIGLKEEFIRQAGAAATGKTFVFYPVWGKTAEYAAKIGTDADLIISGKNMDDAAQCASLLAPSLAKFEIVNYSFPSNNSQRYAGLTPKAINNPFALGLFTALCEDTLTVTFDGQQPQTIKKIFNTTELVVPHPVGEEGTTFAGWATTNDAIAPEFVLEDLTYAKLAAKATEKAITLYPVFVTEEIIEPIVTVAILRGTASNTYITEAEITAIKAAFLAIVEGKGNTDPYIEWIINDGATGAAFNATLTSKVDVVIGANNLTSQEGFPGMYTNEEWIKITNMIANTSRYVGIVSTCDNYELAKEFVCLMAQESVTVTFAGQEPQTITKLYNTVELVVPEITPDTGKEFKGWATVENATAEEFTNGTLTFAGLAAKATEGAITLYPVIVDVQEGPTHYDVVVAYHAYGAQTTTTYFTSTMLTTAQGLITQALTDAGYTAEDYTITWVAVTGKVANAATAIKGLNPKADVAIAHTQCFDSAKADDYFVCAAAYPGTVFTNKTAGDPWFCDSNLKVGVADGSQTNPIAVIIYNTLVALAPAA